MMAMAARLFLNYRPSIANIVIHNFRGPSSGFGFCCFPRWVLLLLPPTPKILESPNTQIPKIPKSPHAHMPKSFKNSNILMYHQRKTKKA